MEANLISLHTAVDDCLGASKLWRYTIPAAVYSRLGTFMYTLYGACRKNLMSLGGHNYCNVDSTMPAVHGHLLPLRRNADAMPLKTQLPSVTDPADSDSGSADLHSYSSSASKYPVSLVYVFFF